MYISQTYRKLRTRVSMSRSPKTSILSDFKTSPEQDCYSSGIDKALII